MAASGVSILSEVGLLAVQDSEQKPVLSRFGDCTLSCHGDEDHRLMIDVGITLVQLSRQALSLFLLEKLRPRTDRSGDAGLPMDSVSFHNTIRAFYSSKCAMCRLSIATPWWQVAYKQSGFLNTPAEGPAPLQFALMLPGTSCILHKCTVIASVVVASKRGDLRFDSKRRLQGPTLLPIQ